MPRPPDVLYHYTAFPALKGVLDSRALWATDICYLNDAAEYRYAVNAVVARIAEVKASGQVDAFEGAALDKLASMLTDGETPEVFVFSLSEQRDQLSQWRAYSGGSGLALGFHTERLANVAAKSGFGLFKCEYDVDCQKTEVSDFVSSSLEMMRTKRTATDTLPGRLVKATWRGVWSNFLRFAPRFKDPAFYEEAEWRLVSLRGLWESPARKVRVARGTLIPYFELSIEEPLLDRGPGSHPWKHELPISRVVIGPSQDAVLARRSAHVAFFSSGVPVPVFEDSKVPLRA